MDIKIPRVSCGFRHVLPTAFDEELSYYEQICKLARTINDVLDYLETQTDKSKEYTDVTVAAATSALRQELLLKINEFNNVLTGQIAQLRIDLERDISNQNNTIDSFKVDVQNQLNSFDGIMDLKIKANNRYIYELIDEGFATIYVINPITGDKVTIQEMFDLLASFHLENAITVDEVISRQATYTQVKAASFTYLEYVQNGKNVFPTGV